MIEHHIEDDRHAAFVALVDEGLVHLLCAVSFIRREIVVGRITPIVVAVKLTYRHQLNGIHTQVLDIIQTLHQSFERTAFCIIVNPQLIDNQVVLVRTLKIERGIRPLESRFAGLDNRHITVCSGGIIQQIRVDFLRLILVIWVQHFLRVQIGNLFLHTIGTLHGVLEAILLTGLQARQGNPEIVSVLVQLIISAEFPVGHVAEQEHPFCRCRLAGGIGT